MTGSIGINVTKKRILTIMSGGLIIAVLALQVFGTSPVYAAETGTWIDGDVPQLKIGDQPDVQPSADCHDTTFPITMSYFGVDLYQVQRSVCAKYISFGQADERNGYIYDGVNGYRVYDSTSHLRSLRGYPSGPGYYEEIPTPYFGPSTFLALYHTYDLWRYGSPVSVNNEVAYKFNSNIPLPILRDSANNLIIKMPPKAISQNGQWMVFYASGLGLIRVNTQTSQMTLFDTTQYNYDLGYAPSVTLAISDDGNTAIRSGIGDNAPSPTTIYDLTNCVGGPFVNAQNNSVATDGCTKRVIQQDLKDAHPGYNGMAYMKFSSDGKYVDSLVDIRTTTGTHEYYHTGELSVAGYVKTPAKDYLALGDSFSSGEGARNYDAATDAGTDKNMCHYSYNSYPDLLAKDLAQAASFHSDACSGATTDDYFSRAQYDQTTDFSILPGEEPQRNYIRWARPNIITISMIGNDIGFSDKIKRCIAGADSCFHFKEDRESIAREIYLKFDRLVSMYQDIQQQAGSDARVYVIGYPQILSTEGTCQYNTSFDLEERQMARGMESYLNAVTKAAAEKAGVIYVDIENSLEGHELCSGDSKTDNTGIAVNGITAGNDIGVHIGKVGFNAIGNESFHPNDIGHRLMANAIETQTNNLTKLMPAAGDPTVTAPYIGSFEYDTFVNGAPASGGIVRRSLYVGEKHVGVLLKGASYASQTILGGLDPAATFKRSTSLLVQLQSTPLTIGTLAVDASGQVSGSVQIPDGIEPGFHSIHIIGQNFIAQDIDVNYTVYIAASEDDIDGDGIPNSEEKCLYVQPANIDQDHDGIDDACDSQIDIGDVTPPVVTGSVSEQPNANGWYNSDVTINWAASDPEPSSGTPTQPSPTLASEEGNHTYTSEESCDPASNCATGSLDLKIDKSLPTITYSLSPAANSNGWNNGEVLISFSCADAVSGIANCSSPQTVSAVDGLYMVTGTAEDNAGNTNSINAIVQVDTTTPTVLQTSSSAPNINGWYNSDVTIETHCNDALSGVASCSDAQTVSSEGANQQIASIGVDNADNSLSVSMSVSLDKTAPTLGGVSWTMNPKALDQTTTLDIPAADNLSGLRQAEYYIGDQDPGVGNATPMQLNGNSISTDFGTDLVTGVYKVTVRAQDYAGNWSEPVSDYLVVYDPAGTHVTAQKKVTPSIANGDVLPGLSDAGQADQAQFGFNVRYNSDGSIHKESDFQVTYQTGDKCNSGKTVPASCHVFELNATSIAWLTTQGENHSTGIFQGVALMNVDGVETNVLFRVTALDGQALDGTTQDHLRLTVYNFGDNPNTAIPLYILSDDLPRGNIHVTQL